MENLYERLTDLCGKKGITAYQFCKDTGNQPSMMTDLKAGRQHGVSAKKAQIIADYFGVSVDYILYGKQKKTATIGDDQLTEKDRNLIEWFRSLPEEKQKAILISQDAPTGLL